MRKIVLVMLFLRVCLSLSFAQNYQTLLRFYQTKDYKSAQTYLFKFENDTSIQWLSEIAYVMYQQKNDTQAIQYYEQLLKQNPSKSGDYLSALGQIYKRKRRFKDAFSYFEKAINQGENQLNLYQELAEITDSASRKISYLKSALELTPYDSNIAISLSNIYQNESNYQDSYDILHTVFQKDSNDMTIAEQLISPAFYLEKYAEVIHLCKKIESLGEVSVYISKYKAKSYFRTQHYQKTIHILHDIEKKGEILSEYDFYILASSYKTLKDLKTAEIYFEKAIKAGISENISYYYTQLSEINIEQKNYTKSLAQLKKGIFFKNDPLFNFQIATIYDYYLKKQILALPYYQKFVSQTPNTKDLQIQIKYAKDRITTFKHKK